MIKENPTWISSGFDFLLEKYPLKGAETIGLMIAKHLKLALTIYIKQARFAHNKLICFSFVSIEMNKLSMWLTMSLPSQIKQAFHVFVKS
jgi:hypothetical protein